MQLEAVEPTDGGFATCNIIGKDALLMDARVKKEKRVEMYEAIKERLPDPLFHILVHIKYQREIPNFIRPKTFNEKVLYRKLFDRRPLLSTFTDKYAVREYVAEKVGSQILPELYYTTTEPETIPFDTLPDRFVLKPSHGSGWIELVPDKAKIDQESLIKICKYWLSQNYYKLNREWVYKDIQPRIMVQEFIEDGHVLTPNDYKLFVYNGVTAFIDVLTSRFEDITSDHFNPKWEKLPISCRSYKSTNGSIPRPKHFDEMLAAAGSLGSGVDFVRIDFYDTDRKLYFGEITTVPGAGMHCFDPKHYDMEFGKLWQVS